MFALVVGVAKAMRGRPAVTSSVPMSTAAAVSKPSISILCTPTPPRRSDHGSLVAGRHARAPTGRSSSNSRGSRPERATGLDIAGRSSITSPLRWYSPRSTSGSACPYRPATASRTQHQRGAALVAAGTRSANSVSRTSRCSLNCVPPVPNREATASSRSTTVCSASNRGNAGPRSGTSTSGSVCSSSPTTTAGGTAVVPKRPLPGSVH